MEQDVQLIKKVFIADDDADDRELVKDAFAEKSVADIEEFSDGKALYDRLCQLRLSDFPDLIVLDLHMPLWPADRTVRELAPFRKIHAFKIVVFSTSSNPDEKKLFQKLDVPMFTKPANMLKLKETVASFLQC